MERSKHPSRWLALLILVGLPLAACSDTSSKAEPDAQAATVEPVAGSELARVTLTADAAKRLDITTTSVTAGGTTKGTQIPYGAVLYDPSGSTWAFVKTADLTFLRAAITVDHIEGDVAFLSAGPSVGTDVVSVGAPELYGAEIGVGDE